MKKVLKTCYEKLWSTPTVTGLCRVIQVSLKLSFTILNNNWLSLPFDSCATKPDIYMLTYVESKIVTFQENKMHFEKLEMISCLVLLRTIKLKLWTISPLLRMIQLSFHFGSREDVIHASSCYQDNFISCWLCNQGKAVNSIKESFNEGFIIQLRSSYKDRGLGRKVCVRGRPMSIK